MFADGSDEPARSVLRRYWARPAVSRLQISICTEVTN